MTIWTWFAIIWLTLFLAIVWLMLRLVRKRRARKTGATVATARSRRKSAPNDQDASGRGIEVAHEGSFGRRRDDARAGDRPSGLLARIFDGDGDGAGGDGGGGD